MKKAIIFTITISILFIIYTLSGASVYRAKCNIGDYVGKLDIQDPTDVIFTPQPVKYDLPAACSFMGLVMYYPLYLQGAGYFMLRYPPHLFFVILLTFIIGVLFEITEKWSPKVLGNFHIIVPILLIVIYLTPWVMLVFSDRCGGLSNSPDTYNLCKKKMKGEYDDKNWFLKIDHCEIVSNNMEQQKCLASYYTRKNISGCLSIPDWEIRFHCIEANPSKYKIEDCDTITQNSYFRNDCRVWFS